MVAEVAAKIPDVVQIGCQLSIERLWIFGSALGNGGTRHFDDESDVDFLVEIDRAVIPLNGFKDPFWQLWMKLEDLFSPRAVQVVELDDIKDPLFRAELQRTRQLIYERSRAKAAG